MQLAAAATYPEPAVLAICRAAARGNCLTRLFTTLHPGPWLSGVGRLLPSTRLRRELSRRSLPDIAPSAVTSTAPGGELLHRAARLLPHSEALAQAIEDRGKAWFDAAVARRLDELPADVVLAMPGSAERTLRAARRLGQLAVLNMVNNHPRHRNQLLSELADLPARHHELIAEGMVRRVERELEQADLVLVPSRLVAEQLREEGVPAERAAIFPYTVDLTRFWPASSEPASTDVPLRCLFVGHICHGKGISVLLEAARRLQTQPVVFELVGPCRAPELVRSLPENAIWLGSLPQVQVGERMRAADVLLLPSIGDAYGLVTLEAMACGRPVVVSDLAGSSELITDGEEGLIVPAGDVSSLALAVERLLDDPESRRAMGLAARARVESHPGWDAYGEGVMRFLSGRLSATSQHLEPAPA